MNQSTDKMNCEEYRQAQAADPGFEGGAEHLASCDDCRAYNDELQALNDKIAKALDIEVPELVMPDLPEITADNVAVLADRRSVSGPARFAIAASVLLAAFLGFRFAFVDDVQGSIADQVLAHVDHEPYALTSVRPVSNARLARIVPANIATMNNDSGLITYAQSCKINGKPAPHLVVQGENGPITIILMPEGAVEEERTIIDGESVHGVVIKNGNGSIAIIGEKEEPLDGVIENVMDSVTWST